MSTSAGLAAFNAGVDMDMQGSVYHATSAKCCARETSPDAEPTTP